jgi:hypothetical protein
MDCICASVAAISSQSAIALGMSPWSAITCAMLLRVVAVNYPH